MSEHDPLELELAALRPCELSLELKQRIAAQLAPEPVRLSPSRWTLVWQSSAVASLLAASILAIALWQLGNETPDPNGASLSFDVTESTFDSAAPSYWTYHRALVESPEAADALLDAHALCRLARRSSTEPVVVLTYFNSEMDSVLGEL